MDNPRHLSIIVDICEKVKKLKDLDKTNIIEVLHSVMEMVEIIVNLSGEEKKEITINSMNYIVDKQDIKEENKIELKELINILAPITIDTIVKVGNGVSSLVRKSCLCF